MNYEVPNPILNTPFLEPAQHWFLEEGEPPDLRAGRRKAGYFYRDPKAPPRDGEHQQVTVKVIDDRGNELLVVKSVGEVR